MPAPLPDDIQDLIAGYVLGDLTVAETDQLTHLAAQHPEVRQELLAMQTSYDLLPHGLPKVLPPAALRQAVMAQPLAVLPDETAPTDVSPDGLPGVLSRRWRNLLAAALALGALVLAADNLRLRRQLRLAQTQSSPVANILQQPNSRTVTLTGTGNRPAAGTLLFTPGQWQEVVIAFQGLPPLPPEQIYRMWLALEDGTVIFCGEFNTDPSGRVFLDLRPPQLPPPGVKASELFVTVEGAEAAPNPASQRVMAGAV